MFFTLYCQFKFLTCLFVSSGYIHFPVLIGMFLTLYCKFNFLTCLLFSSGYIHFPVLIIVLYYLAAAACTVPSCFTSFVFPSHTLAYSSFGNITLIRKHILILVPTFESVRIASILPTCALPFPISFALCASPEQNLDAPTPRYVYWSTIGNCLLPIIHTTTAHFFTFAVTLHFQV